MARQLTRTISDEKRNYLINGNFDFWQRGQTFAVNARAYGPDRYIQLRGVAGMTVSRQSAAGAPFNANYCARVARDSGNSNTTTLYFGQNIETANSRSLAGKTVTYSFWARAGANYSAASNILQSYIETGTGVDQPGLGVSSFTGSVITITNHTLTTSWQRFNVTIDIPANVTQVQVHLRHNPVGTAGAADYFEVAQFMLNEDGPARFRTAGATPVEELALCRRYFEKSYQPNVFAGTTGDHVGSSYVQKSGVSNFIFYVYFRTQKRIVPAITLYSVATGVAGTIDENASAVSGSSDEQGVDSFLVRKNAATVDQSGYRAHWYAEAEL